MVSRCWLAVGYKKPTSTLDTDLALGLYLTEVIILIPCPLRRIHDASKVHVEMFLLNTKKNVCSS